MKDAIITHNLTRSFVLKTKTGGLLRKKSEHIALKPTNLCIKKGEIVGLVGANGAGKTTLLKLLSGLIHPTSGSAEVLGFKPWQRQDLFLKNMSVVLGQKNQLWWDIPAEDSFELLMAIYDLDPQEASKKVAHLATILDCTHVLRTPLRKLSLGERMKMELIGSLLHEPELLFLDEPTIGLDILAQTSVRDFLRSYAQQKKPTIVLTSHYMDDIAELVDRLLLIRKGEIVFDGSIPEFSREHDGNFESAIRNFLAEGRLQ